LPTCVNNVETFACIPRILARGADWFSRIGTHDSTGTKLHSISGDCNKPGVYEVPFGATVKELLELADAPDVAAVQIGGPSGHLIGPKDFDRKIAFEDLPSGGSFMIFKSQRDLLQIVRGFSEFFKEESCGWCVPCRVGTALFPRLLDKILGKQGTLADLHQLESLAGTVARTSRCGLGQTAPNPILDSLKNFRPLWDSQLTNLDFQPDFDLEKSLAEATQLRTDARERISLL
jgi:[NiFe] hydrogenase diaphorase moiety large subunit